jgi:hypothetical protein
VTDGEIAALWSAWQQRLRLGDHDITLNFEDEGVEAQVHRDAWAVFEKASDDACERFIDRMAYVLLDLEGGKEGKS